MCLHFSQSCDLRKDQCQRPTWCPLGPSGSWRMSSPLVLQPSLFPHTGRQNGQTFMGVEQARGQHTFPHENIISVQRSRFSRAGTGLSHKEDRDEASRLPFTCLPVLPRYTPVTPTPLLCCESTKLFPTSQPLPMLVWQPRGPFLRPPGLGLDASHSRHFLTTLSK